MRINIRRGFALLILLHFIFMGVIYKLVIHSPIIYTIYLVVFVILGVSSYVYIVSSMPHDLLNLQALKTSIIKFYILMLLIYNQNVNKIIAPFYILYFITFFDFKLDRKIEHEIFQQSTLGETLFSTLKQITIATFSFFLLRFAYFSGSYYYNNVIMLLLVAELIFLLNEMRILFTSENVPENIPMTALIIMFVLMFDIIDYSTFFMYYLILYSFAEISDNQYHKYNQELKKMNEMMEEQAEEQVGCGEQVENGEQEGSGELVAGGGSARKSKALEKRSVIEEHAALEGGAELKEDQN